MTYCSIVARRDSENSRFKRNTYVYNLCPDTNLKIRIHARNKQLGQDFLWDVSLYLKKTSHFIVAVTQSAALNGKVLALIAGFAIKSNNNLPSRHILLSVSFEISYSFPSTCPVSSTPNFKTRGALENSVDVVLSEAFFVLFSFVLFCFLPYCFNGYPNGTECSLKRLKLSKVMICWTPFGSFLHSSPSAEVEDHINVNMINIRGTPGAVLF